MDQDQRGHKKPNLGTVQIGIKNGERDKAVDQDVSELSKETANLELVKLLELKNKVRDKMRQDQF